MASAQLLQALDAMHRAGGKIINVTEPLAEQRAKVEEKIRTQVLDPQMRFEDVAFDGLTAVWVTPPQVTTDLVYLFFHGGAYAKGRAASSHGALIGHCRAMGARALSVDYRLAPEHPYPAALEDARTAYRHLLASGLSAGRIAVGGSSAGGGLAAALVLACRDAGDPQPLAAVLVSPWGDLTNTGESVAARAARDPLLSKPYLDRFAAYYVAGADPRDPMISPSLADYEGVTTAILAQVGSEEVLHDDAVRIVERARAAGCRAELEVYDKGFHGWQNAGEAVPEAADACRNAGRFVTRVSQDEIAASA